MIKKLKEKFRVFVEWIVDWKQLLIFFLFLIAIYCFWHYLIAPIRVVEVSMSKIPEFEALKYELFRDLLVAILSFITIGGGIIYLALQREVKEKLGKEVKRMKSLLFCKQNFYWCLDNEKKHELEIEDILQEKKFIGVTPLWLKKNINISRKTLSLTENLDKIENETTILNAKNNLAYYLAINKSEEDEAKELAKKIYRKAGKYDNSHWIDTYVWVLYRFAENEKEKEKARNIFFNELYNQREMMSDIEFIAKLVKYKPFFDKLK